MNQPICYSYRRCPYAMRARMALDYAGVEPHYREIKFSDKPPQMLAASPKGTVPVLVTQDNEILEESWDIIRWALDIHDPESWLPDCEAKRTAIDELVSLNDNEFKRSLDRYKYADRYPELTVAQHRENGTWFLDRLEAELARNNWLLGDSLSAADIVVFPFIRQFSMVEPKWFATAPYPRTREWLERLIGSPRFQRIMEKRPVWDYENGE